MAKPKTIMICGDEGIFNTSVVALLTAVEGWQIVNISHQLEHEILNLILQEKLQPDIIIIYKELVEDTTKLIWQLLEEFPAARVVMMNLQRNVMDIYSKQNFYAQDFSDLIQVIDKST